MSIDSEKAQLLQALQEAKKLGMMPISSNSNIGPLSAGIDPIHIETPPYSERPIAPITAGNVTYLGQTLLEKYVEIAMAEYIRQFPNDSPADLARKSIQLATEMCRQLEIINSMHHGHK